MDKGFFKDLEDLISFKEEGIYSQVLVKGDKFNHTLMCLSKGTDIDTHTSTKKGSVYVIKGSGVFKLFDKEIEMKLGTYIFMPANAPHSLKAEEDLAILLCLSE